MSATNVIISVDDDYIEQIHEVADRLKASGLQSIEVLSSAGIISGSIDSEQLNHLNQIEGVNYVENERNYQLPPPGSDIQ